MPPIPTSLTDRRIVERNRKLAAAIAAGHSPLDDQIVGTLAAQAAALLDVPGPRVTQLLAELDAARARIAELEGSARDLVASANLVHDSAAAIVDRAPVDRFIALLNDARKDADR